MLSAVAPPLPGPPADPGDPIGLEPPGLTPEPPPLRRVSASTSSDVIITVGVEFSFSCFASAASDFSIGFDRLKLTKNKICNATMNICNFILENVKLDTSNSKVELIQFKMYPT